MCRGILPRAESSGRLASVTAPAVIQPPRLSRRECFRTRLDRELDKPMTVLALVFLAVMTLALPHSFISVDDAEVIATPSRLTPLERSRLLSITAAGVLALLAIPFWAESLTRLLYVENGAAACGVPRATRSRKFHLIAVALVPPLRATLNPATLPERAWLPLMGWRRETRHLSRHVQKAFGIPMLLVGLLILPVLGIEMAFSDLVYEHEGLALGLDCATRLIWLAFALEFLVVLSVTPRKLEYAIRHWVDLVIILLPFLAFLRSLQIIRAGQLLRAGRMSKLASTYRLRGLAVKLLQAFLMLRVLENASETMARKKIDRVRETIGRREEEIQDLRAELKEMRSGLARRLRERRAAKRAKAAVEAEEAAASSDPRSPEPPQPLPLRRRFRISRGGGASTTGRPASRRERTGSR